MVITSFLTYRKEKMTTIHPDISATFSFYQIPLQSYIVRRGQKGKFFVLCPNYSI